MRHVDLPLKTNFMNTPFTQNGIHTFSPSSGTNPFSVVNKTTNNSNGTHRWLLPYADLVTLLLVLFVAMALMGVKPSVAKTKTKAKTETSQTQSNAVAAEKLSQPQTQAVLQSEQGQKIQKLLAQSKTPVTISEDDRGVILSFQEKIFFAPGSAQIQPQAFETLHRLADALKNTDGNIRVEGHTDNTPIQTSQYPSNWELSTHRATAILRFLIQNESLQPKRLSAAGFGEYQPKVQNTSETNRKLNRRVDIVLLPIETPLNLPKESKLIVKPVPVKTKTISDDPTLAIISEEIDVPQAKTIQKTSSNNFEE